MMEVVLCKAEGKFSGVSLITSDIPKLLKTLPGVLSNDIGEKLRNGNYRTASEARNAAMEVLGKHGYTERELYFVYS